MSEETIRKSFTEAKELDPAERIRAEVARLAKLDREAYLAERRAVAKALGIPVIELGKLVQKERPAPKVAAREPLAPPPPEPWTEPVNSTELFDAIDEFLQRFLVLNKHALTAIALWTAWTYCFEIATVSPRLRLRSPTKRCGKTRTIEVLTLLIPRSLAASSISPSALFRTVDLEHCPIFLDEADTYLSANAKEDDKDLRRLLNSGHTRTSAYVIRSVPVGEGRWEPKRFSTWAPLVIAGIGKIHGTTEDRSIGITMQRKPRGRAVQNLDPRRNPGAHVDAANLASQLARFAKDNMEKLATASAPDIPKGLDDRAAQSWDLLFAIADLVGGGWPQRARDAAAVLSGNSDDRDDSLGVLLLADVRELLVEGKTDKLSSKAICGALHALESRPWAEYGKRQKPLTQNHLAHLLAPFEIAPHTIRMSNGSTAKGYERKDFREAFESYLPKVETERGPSEPNCPQNDSTHHPEKSCASPQNLSPNRHTATSQRRVRENGNSQTVTEDACDASKNGRLLNGESGCDAVMDENPETDADHQNLSDRERFKL